MAGRNSATRPRLYQEAAHGPFLGLWRGETLPLRVYEAESDHMFAGKNVALVQEMDWVVLKLV